MISMLRGEVVQSTGTEVTLLVSGVGYRIHVPSSIDGKIACGEEATFHTMLIHNLTKVLAGKIIMLTRKMEHITKKTTREKVLSYLSECAIKAGKNSFDIPFDRQELADYLAVERSALSKTLCSMRDEGVLEFRKNRFSLNIMFARVPIRSLVAPHSEI